MSAPQNIILVISAYEAAKTIVDIYTDKPEPIIEISLITPNPPKNRYNKRPVNTPEAGPPAARSPPQIPKPLPVNPPALVRAPAGYFQTNQTPRQ